MHFVNLRTGVHEKITLPENYSTHRRYSFSMTEAAGVTVDLDKGTILIHPENKSGEVNREITIAEGWLQHELAGLVFGLRNIPHFQS